MWVKALTLAAAACFVVIAGLYAAAGDHRQALISTLIATVNTLILFD